MSNTMNSAARFHKLAKKDRNRQIAVISVTAVLNLAIFVIGFHVQNTIFAMTVLASALLVVNACGAFLVIRLAAKMERNHFEEGMYFVLGGVPMICTVTDETGTPLHCNDLALNLFGATDRQEYFSKLFTDYLAEFQPDGTRSLEKAGVHIKAAFENGVESFQWWHQQQRGGEQFPCAVTLVAASVYGTSRVLVFTQDLRETERLRAQEEALKSRMKAILDSAPMVCALFDEEENILDVNQEVKNLFNIADEKTYIEHFNDFLPPVQPDGSNSIRKSSEMLKKALREGSACYEWLYQRRDGTPIPTEETVQRVTIDGKNLVICYSRDLREFYRNKEKDILVQQNIQTMMEQLNGHVSEQAIAVTESAAAIEEMVASIQAVTKALTKNADQVRELQTASRIGHDGITDVVADIRGITQESESLLEINAVMESIASQTNLLSMNAAIEAAHAGESGRGFAVVADEIRKLAESSSEQSKTIGSVLKTIKDSIDKITKSTDNALNRFEEIDTGIKTMAEQERNVLNAMEEQKQGSRQILQAIGQVNDITQRVKSDAQQMIRRQQETQVETYNFLDLLTK